MGELFDKTKGRIKEAAGKVIGDRKLANEGMRDQLGH